MESRESPTELLIRSLENVEGAEDVIVVYRKIQDGKNVVDWQCNEVPTFTAVSMLEMTKLGLIEETRREE